MLKPQGAVTVQMRGSTSQADGRGGGGRNLGFRGLGFKGLGSRV